MIPLASLILFHLHPAVHGMLTQTWITTFIEDAHLISACSIDFVLLVTKSVPFVTRRAMARLGVAIDKAESLSQHNSIKRASNVPMSNFIFASCRSSTDVPPSTSVPVECLWIDGIVITESIASCGEEVVVVVEVDEG